jgi:Ca2+-binding RTX toxin-like protein
MSTRITIKTSLFPVTGPGFFYAVNDEIVTILHGVQVESNNNSGVYSDLTFLNSVLVNHGLIVSNDFWGVIFNGTNGLIDNAAGGVITGAVAGASINGGVAVLLNNGSITGQQTRGVFFSPDTTSVTFSNHGFIYGGLSGVEDQSNGAGIFDNFGIIRSSGYGFYLYTGTALTVIDNAAGAVIKGQIAALYADATAGRFHLTNDGTINGTVDDANGASDIIINHGRIDGAVIFAGGHDYFDGTGGLSGPIFAGGSDRIIAGNGNVRIHVGAGSDTLTAGPGADRFIFDSALTGQVDRITNFKPGLDRIVLSATDFAGVSPVGHLLAHGEFHVGKHASAPGQHIVYNPANGFLYYDPDGNGAAPQVHFATLLSHPTIHSTDFLVAA